MTDLPRIKAVSAAKTGFVLNVEWKDGTTSKVDLVGLIHSSRHFKIFADDHAAFVRVKPVEFGNGVEWDNGLDYAATTLQMLAEEQKPMSGQAVAAFAKSRNLNNNEMAELLDCTPKSIRNFYEQKHVPGYVAFAIRRFERDITAFAAHYRPVTVRPRGRPAQKKTG